MLSDGEIIDGSVFRSQGAGRWTIQEAALTIQAAAIPMIWVASGSRHYYDFSTSASFVSSSLTTGILLSPSDKSTVWWEMWTWTTLLGLSVFRAPSRRLFEMGSRGGGALWGGLWCDGGCGVCYCDGDVTPIQLRGPPVGVIMSSFKPEGLCRLVFLLAFFGQSNFLREASL